MMLHKLTLYDANGNAVASYNDSNVPSDGWSATVTGDTVYLKFSSGEQNEATGYTVDKIRVTYITNAYLMQDRLDVAKDALLYSIDALSGKMNWGFSSFKYTSGGSGDVPTFECR